MRWDPAEIAASVRRERAARLAATRDENLRPAARVEGAPPSTATGELLLVGIALVAVLTVGVVATVVFVAAGLDAGSDEVSAGAPAGAVVLPVEIAPRWQVDVDDRVQHVVLGAAGVVVVTGSTVQVHDVELGDLLWSRPIADPFADVSFVDGAVAIVEDRSVVGTSAIALVDVATGEERWSRASLDSDFASIDGALFELSIGRGRSSVRLSLLDAATGAPSETVMVDDGLQVASPYVVSVTGERRRLLLMRTLEPVSAAFDPFELRSVALVGDSVVGFDRDATIIAFDASGRRSDQRPFVSDAFGDFTGRAELVGGVPGHDVGIVASGTSLGFRLVDDRIEEVWTVSGRVGQSVATERGPVSVARVVDGATGEINVALIDPLDGRQVAVTDAGVTRELDPVVGWNGYVVAPEVGAADRILTALDFDGLERWRLSLPRRASYETGVGLVAVVERDIDRATVTVYG